MLFNYAVFISVLNLWKVVQLAGQAQLQTEVLGAHNSCTTDC